MKKLAFILTFSIILFSCSTDNDSGNFVLETLPIKEATVPTEFNFGSQHEITIKYDLPNGCYSFYDLFYRANGNARTVAVVSSLNLDITCTQATIEKEYTFTVNVVQQEDYTFRFWKGKDNDDNDIFEEVIVPVN